MGEERKAFYPLLPDPNWGTNRIPLETELQTIRQLHFQNHLLVQQLRSQLATARESNSQIRMRYEKLKRDIDSVVSELNASTRYIMILEQQESMLQKEEQYLQGLVHPIRRCSDDVLRLIFDWAVELTSDNKDRAAPTIVGVCQRWRTLARSAPSLWAHIVMSMDGKNTDAMLYSIRQARTLVRATPVEVIIKNFGTSKYNKKTRITPDDMLSLLYAELGYFATIKSIVLEVGDGPDAAKLLAQKFPHPYFPVERLILSGVELLSAGWNYASVLQSFPSLKRFDLRSKHFIQSVTFSCTPQLPDLRSLRLYGIAIPSVGPQLSQFNALEELKLEDISMEGGWDQDMTMPKLHTLHVQDVDAFFWYRLTAPRLQWLITNEHDVNPTGVIGFMRRHPTICHLETMLEHSHFQQISRYLPRLSRLGMWRFDIKCFTNEDETDTTPLFPNLEHLATYLMEGYKISEDEFDQMVTARFISDDLQEREGEKRRSRMTSWDIAADDDDELKSGAWLGSKNMEHFETTFIEEEIRYNSMRHKMVQLRWFGGRV